MKVSVYHPFFKANAYVLKRVWSNIFYEDLKGKMEIKFGKPRPSATEIKNISDVTAKQ